METSVVIAGFGGQGILFAGKVLARAGMQAGHNVTWLPSYGPEMRGGTANVTVIISDEEIGSPLAPQPQTALVFNNPSMDKYEPLVAPGGTLIYNSSLIDCLPRRVDITTIPVPANDIAAAIGDEMVANMVALGAAVAATGMVSLVDVIQALWVHSTEEPELLKMDQSALQQGAELAQAVAR